MQAAIDYLFKLGHRKIGFLNVKSNQHAVGRRDTIFREVIESKGLEIKENFILFGESDSRNHKQIGYELVMSRLSLQKDIPTAFICLNDNIAIGAIKAFSILGKKVPENISVIGFDDYKDSMYYIPSLTTVRVPVHEIGYCACENVERWIKGKRRSIDYCLKTELIIRESCGGVL